MNNKTIMKITKKVNITENKIEKNKK
jgi:hypothetical protein